VNAQPIPAPGYGASSHGLPHLSREFLCRAGLVAIFATIAHQLRWEWLQFLTSEAILRISASLGMATARMSVDTIRVQGQPFQFVIACTFVDVFMGSIPLLWDLKKSLLKNASWLVAAAMILFGFNVVRLEIGQVLYAHGASWTLADDVLGGFAYFTVWLFLWWQRSWELTPLSVAPVLRKNSVRAAGANAIKKKDKKAASPVLQRVRVDVYILEEGQFKRVQQVNSQAFRRVPKTQPDQSLKRGNSTTLINAETGQVPFREQNKAF
jgi:hypothetical protein